MSACKLNTDELINYLKAMNDSYRAGEPVVSDDVYDSHIEELRLRDPDHPYLQTVESEESFGAGKIRHPIPMLSTEKAYESKDVLAWIKKCIGAASKVGIDSKELVFRATPKLDGMAAKSYADLQAVATRGNGLTGNDITACIEKGVREIIFDKDHVGEIVMHKSYFEKHLADDFEHPRNAVVGAVSADDPSPLIKKALSDGAIVFMMFDHLDGWRGGAKSLLQNLDAIYKRVTDIDFPTDGMVIEVVSGRVKAEMGATAHHNRWQIAKKVRGDKYPCRVTGIAWQVGRTGKVTPVIQIEPTKIAGATVTNVTGHHAGNVFRNGIKAGALIEVTRSGEVIPFMTRVIERFKKVTVPNHCPCCNNQLEWDNDFLICRSVSCPAQQETTMIHFFKTVNINGFGPAVVKKLIAANKSVPDVFKMTVDDMQQTGISEGIARNLISAMTDARVNKIEDWRLCGAFGIHLCGRGTSRKVLKDISLRQLISGVKWSDLERIDGVGNKAAESIYSEMANRREYFLSILDLGWNFEEVSEPDTSNSAVSGKSFVFTGTMTVGNRSDMEAMCRAKGGIVQSAVSKKTNYLVAGQKAGSKAEKAEKIGVVVLTECQFLNSLNEVQ